MEDYNELKEMVSEIHKALIGDQYREEGLIKKVDRHDKKIVKHEAYIYMIIGAYLLLVFLLSFGTKLHDLLR